LPFNYVVSAAGEMFKSEQIHTPSLDSYFSRSEVGKVVGQTLCALLR
jgi:hypothetical protein